MISGQIESKNRFHQFFVWGGSSGRVPRAEEGRGLPSSNALRRLTKSTGVARRARMPLTDDAPGRS